MNKQKLLIVVLRGIFFPQMVPLQFIRLEFETVDIHCLSLVQFIEQDRRTYCLRITLYS